jgi:cytochrome c556
MNKAGDFCAQLREIAFDYAGAPPIIPPGRKGSCRGHEGEESMRILKAVTAFAVGAALAVSAGMALAQQKPADAIKARQEAMKALGGDSKIINDALKTEAPDKAAVAEAFHRIADKGKHVTMLFPKGSGPETGMKTRAKPEIWTDSANFKAAADSFVAVTVDLAKVSASSSVDDLKADAKKMNDACGGCHKPFRAPEEKKAG